MNKPQVTYHLESVSCASIGLVTPPYTVQNASTGILINRENNKGDWFEYGVF